MRAWLEGTSPAEFSRSLLREPLARPCAASAVVPLLGWDTLGRILASEPVPDVLVVAGGELLEVPAPRSLLALKDLMARGIGVVVRRAERCDGGLAELARSFESDLGGEAHVQLFVTPAGTHGFRWHYDREHVFIVQTAGVKDYYLRANTVSARDEPKPDFEAFHRERSPFACARLVAADWLSIPPRWWHMAKAIEDSLSISVGVRG